MKNLKLLLIVFTAISINACKSNQPTVEQSQETAIQTKDRKLENINMERLGQMQAIAQEHKERLNLSAEQEIQYDEISRKYAQQMMGLRNDGSSRMQKFKKMKNIRQNKDAEMKELLSSSQYDLYLENNKELQYMRKNQRN